MYLGPRTHNLWPWQASPPPHGVSSPPFHHRLPKMGDAICIAFNKAEEQTTEWYPSRGPRAMSAPKWSEAKDPNSGNSYFWNVDTNETSWARPVAAGSAPPPPPPDTREQNVAASIDDPEQLLLNPPDPNLICPICLKLFAQPVRTACG